MANIKNKNEFDILLEKCQKHAKECGFRLNTNSDIVKSLVLALIKRKHQYGKEYCPCRFVTGDKERDEKIVCPCVYHKKEIEEQGCCHCHLFVA